MLVEDKNGHHNAATGGPADPTEPQHQQAQQCSVVRTADSHTPTARQRSGSEMWGTGGWAPHQHTCLMAGQQQLEYITHSQAPPLTAPVH